MDESGTRNYLSLGVLASFLLRHPLKMYFFLGLPSILYLVSNRGVFIDDPILLTILFGFAIPYMMIGQAVFGGVWSFPNVFVIAAILFPLFAITDFAWGRLLRLLALGTEPAATEDDPLQRD